MNPIAESLFKEKLPYLTQDIPGIQGDLKTHPEDFIVEEIPAYHPEGAGDHLFLWIEKKEISTDNLAKHLSQTLGISKRDIGKAGLKDKQSVSRQYLSIPAQFQNDLEKSNADFFEILETGLHKNKLKTGHLKGNRFQILVRNSNENAFEIACQIRDIILQKGFPNYYGTQRFGHKNQTVHNGLELLLNPTSTSSAKLKRNRSLLRLSLSAVQSALFNQALSRRMQDDLLFTVLNGDVMKVSESGGVFITEDVEAEQQRFNQREIVTSGPIFGPKMKQATHDASERDEFILEFSGLTPELFSQYKKLTSGTRRAYLVWPEEIQVQEEKEGIRFCFELPSGVYATSLMREFMKLDGV